MGDVNKAKPDETTSSSTGDLLLVVTDQPEWGTLEELLLVSAVNRHGTNNWDSIATELHKHRRFHHHSPLHRDLSPDVCRKKYVDLRRRFNNHAAAAADGDGDGDELLRMVEELRKLRVEQLKREVLKHDVSIVSLQNKVKVLEEEREKNNSSTSSSLLVKPDTDGLEPQPEPIDLRIQPENANKTVEPESSPEKRRGGDSAEDRSVNESNSSKAENTAVEADAKREPEIGGEDPVQRKASGPGESASESKRENSNNDENNNKNNKKIKSSQIQQQQEQGSDVQSSASLTKKKRRRFRVGGGVVNSSGDELEAEELSPANKRISLKSQPLIPFLDFLRSHKHGSVFHRRLPSQVTLLSLFVFFTLAIKNFQTKSWF
ncbi:hypothetical protein RND81_09G261900 [Saponaria officinalis]|uniref:Myb-like domain-containing protein n=1 Tax=Saponaria officinalis TaxID=3572 RepID=A0AAW1IQT5_SAPOF